MKYSKLFILIPKIYIVFDIFFIYTFELFEKTQKLYIFFDFIYFYIISNYI